MEDTTVQSARYVRAIITCKSGQFLAQVNNRVVLGSLTIMVPGCQVAPGESELTALARALRDEVGITLQLDACNCRFLANRTYEFGEGHQKEAASINFYEIEADGSVPRNMSDSVLSVSWLSLGDVRRYLDLDGGNWKIALGVLDAVEAALDPAKSKRVESGRELSRRDGGAADGPLNGSSLPSRLPYGA